MTAPRPNGLLKMIPFILVAGLLYVAAVIGYAKSGKPHIEERTAPVADGVNVALDPVSIDPEKHLLTVRATLFPEGSYLDAAENEFAVPIRVTSRTLKESASYDIDAGQTVGGSYEFDIPVQGDPENYPLDRFEYSNIDYDHGGAHTVAPLVMIEKILEDGSTRPANVGADPDDPGGLVGWTDHWNLVGAGSTLNVKLVMERSGAVIAAVGVVVSLVLAMAALAALVAWSVATARRPIEPTFASWFAAMLFALIPLQNFMPGAPPVGAWIDVFVFLWVEIVLLASLGVFIISWFRFRDPPDYSHLRRARDHDTGDEQGRQPMV